MWYVHVCTCIRVCIVYRCDILLYIEHTNFEVCINHVTTTRLHGHGFYLCCIPLGLEKLTHSLIPRLPSTCIQVMTFEPLIDIINPRRACAARVTVLGLSFCLSVCPSVRLSGTTYSGTTRNKAAKKRYQRVQCHTGLIFKIAIFVKVLRSKVMA